MNVSIAAEPLFHIGSFPFTNSLLAALITVIFLITVAAVLRRKIALVPKGLQNVVELSFEGGLGIMEQVTQDAKQSRKFFPLVFTIFIFILVSNWFGLIPLWGPIGLREVHEAKDVFVPLLRSANSDLNITLALALIVLFTFQFFGIASVGFFKYAGKFINFKGPLKFFLGILELISEIAKLISLSFRLFGNIFAGEVLLLVMMFLIPYVLPVPFLVLEVFVGVIQAFIFAMLTIVFLKIAMTEAHH